MSQKPKYQTPSDQKPPEPVVSAPRRFKPVLSAYLHAPVMMPGGQTESSLTQIKLPGIKLAWVPGEGLLVTHKNQAALIPSANVSIAYIDATQD